MAFDLFPLGVIESRIQWLGKAAKENWVCGFSHDHAVAFARIVSDPKITFAAVPVA
jgi:hypothetical protein